MGWCAGGAEVVAVVVAVRVGGWSGLSQSLLESKAQLNLSRRLRGS